MGPFGKTVWLVAPGLALLLTLSCGEEESISPPANAAPTASFTVTPSSGTTLTTFRVDASGSSDARDPVSALEVRWDWESDGTWDTDYDTLKTAAHQYSTTDTLTILLEVRDTGGLTGAATKTVTVSVEPDTILPSAVTDLTVGSPARTALTLTWTAPGEDGNEGTASRYDVRFTSRPSIPWEHMARVNPGPTPQAPGQAERFTVTGLSAGTTYFFFLATGDEVPNWSGLSNMAEGTTAPPPGDMVLVPPGTFTMGDGAASCGTDEREVTLTHAFSLGQYEVTNREYAEALQWALDGARVGISWPAFVYDSLDTTGVALLIDLASTYCAISLGDGFLFSIDSGKEDYPVVGVTWFGAAAYCDWLNVQAGLPMTYDHVTWRCPGGNPYTVPGYRLPTDAEWEYAAQYDDARVYPWGNEVPDCSRANYWPWPALPCEGAPSGVGSYPAAPEALGLYDMAGNMWEWCNDWHTCHPGTLPETDPTGPESGSERVLRGESWARGTEPRCARRYAWDPRDSDSRFGFRCARSQ